MALQIPSCLGLGAGYNIFFSLLNLISMVRNFRLIYGSFGLIFIVMVVVVGNFNFFYFLRLTWEFLNLES